MKTLRGFYGGHAECISYSGYVHRIEALRDVFRVVVWCMEAVFGLKSRFSKAVLYGCFNERGLIFGSFEGAVCLGVLVGVGVGCLAADLGVVVVG